MFNLPDDVLNYLISFINNIIDLFLSCKYFVKFYNNPRLIKCAELRELSRIPKDLKISDGHRVYSDKNYKIINNKAVEVNILGRRIGQSYELDKKYGSVIVNDLNVRPGILLSNIGPVVKTADSYYFKYIYDPNNVGFKEPKMNMIVVVKLLGVNYEYVVTKLDEFTGTIRMITNGRYSIVDKIYHESTLITLQIAKIDGVWTTNNGNKIIKFGGFL